MPLTLSDADLVRLQGTMRALLSPLDHADPDEWRERVVRSTKALLGADTVAFMLPLPGHVLLHTDADKRGATEEYEAYYGALDVGLRRKRLERKLEVYHGMYDVYDDLEELFGGEMYNDWGVRWGALDPVVMSTEIAADSAPAAIFGYHDQMTANPFGERGLDLLRLLLPAFQSGVHACLLLRTRREGLARALDSLGEGLLVCDLAGRTLHRNAAL